MDLGKGKKFRVNNCKYVQKLGNMRGLEGKGLEN
jgi:hypothetical protein